MGMVSIKGHLRFFFGMLAIFNSKWPTVKLSKKTHILSSFLEFVEYFYMNCMLLDLRSQEIMYQPNVSHFEFKMANTEIVQKCNLTIFLNLWHIFV